MSAILGLLLVVFVRGSCFSELSRGRRLVGFVVVPTSVLEVVLRTAVGVAAIVP
jgi:hypothetical protein